MLGKTCSCEVLLVSFCFLPPSVFKEWFVPRATKLGDVEWKTSKKAPDCSVQTSEQCADASAGQSGVQMPVLGRAVCRCQCWAKRCVEASAGQSSVQMPVLGRAVCRCQCWAEQCADVSAGQSGVQMSVLGRAVCRCQCWAGFGFYSYLSP
jgi:hypothetical protein